MVYTTVFNYMRKAGHDLLHSGGRIPGKWYPILIMGVVGAGVLASGWEGWKHPIGHPPEGLPNIGKTQGYLPIGHTAGEKGGEMLLTKEKAEAMSTQRVTAPMSSVSNTEAVEKQVTKKA